MPSARDVPLGVGQARELGLTVVAEHSLLAERVGNRRQPPVRVMCIGPTVGIGDPDRMPDQVCRRYIGSDVPSG